MTRYAFLADMHGRSEALRSTLQDAGGYGVSHYIALGDVGTDACYNLLRRVQAQGIFGNYEVTKWDGLSPENQAWVHELGPLWIGDTFLAAHAAPYLPANLGNVDDVLSYILETHAKWQTLFPRLDQDEEARWLTYAELEMRDKLVFFHGHTHVQAGWCVEPDGTMRLVHDGIIHLEPDQRYIVGVGSVGQPEDGAAPCYAIYDESEGTVFWRRIRRGGATQIHSRQ
jgi:hypothetical protein